MTRTADLLDHAMWVVLALVLGYSGVDKLVHYVGFVNAINDYRILPFPMGAVLAPAIIAAELAIAVALFRRSSRALAAMLGGSLLILFTVALGVNRALGARGVCGCWFSINMGNDWMHLGLNLILIVLAFWTWWAARPAPGGEEAR